MDITTVILDQHQEQRRTFAMLDDVPPGDVTALGAIWKRLAVLLEVHAEAEERFFYPRLLEIGSGPRNADGPDDEVKDAIVDHNDIRDAIARAAREQVGSDAWWQAVTDTRIANSDHMAEEEREDLADFRRHADLQTRHEIAVEFLTYGGAHADGVEATDRDAAAYVARGGPQ
jgi:hypothetical protein